MVQFVSSIIPVFDAKLINIKEDYYVASSSENWKVSMCVTLKNVLTENQDQSPLLHMAKKC